MRVDVSRILMWQLQARDACENARGLEMVICEITMKLPEKLHTAYSSTLLCVLYRIFKIILQ
jgi:hypothetical protein